jgi:hypothetical protein
MFMSFMQWQIWVNERRKNPASTQTRSSSATWFAVEQAIVALPGTTE